MESIIEDLCDQGVDRFNIDLFDEAIEVFTKVLGMNPDHPDALYYRALARSNKGDFDQAIADFTAAIEKNPLDADCFIGRGEALQHKEKLKQALEDFKAALDIEPENADYKKLVNNLEERASCTG